MRYILIVAGLDPFAFDKIKGVSTKKYFGEGILLARPLKMGQTYSENCSMHYLKAAAAYLQNFYDDNVCTILIYVDYKNNPTETFYRSFFPFALAQGVDPPLVRLQNRPADHKRALNDFADQVFKAVNRLKDAVAAVRSVFSGNNLTPLLLPTRNFQSKRLIVVLQDLFTQLASSRNLPEFLNDAKNRILEEHPWVTPPDSRHRCLSDGILHFKSPGSARHGKARFIAMETIG